MREQIIAQLRAEYAAKRHRAEAQAALARREIVAKAPIFSQLEPRLARIMAQCAATGEDPVPKVQALRDRANADLAAAGYQSGDLAPRYDCAACRDTGYLDGAPRRFCACFERRLREEVVARSGLGTSPGHTFEAFDLLVFPDEAVEGGLSQRETMRRLLRFAQKWAEALPHPEKRDVLLTGPTGLGKTFLLDCMASRAIERGFTALRLTAFRLLTAMRQYHMGRDEAGLLDVMLEVDVLYIDDLGTEPLLENISVEYLFTVLNERQQAKKSTLVATNLSLSELRARYTERITSRLLDGERAAVFRLEGSDVRLRRDRT